MTSFARECLFSGELTQPRHKPAHFSPKYFHQFQGKSLFLHWFNELKYSFHGHFASREKIFGEIVFGLMLAHGQRNSWKVGWTKDRKLAQCF